MARVATRPNHVVCVVASSALNTATHGLAEAFQGERRAGSRRRVVGRGAEKLQDKTEIPAPAWRPLGECGVRTLLRGDW
jgi:hypothetical protein